MRNFHRKNGYLGFAFESSHIKYIALVHGRNKKQTDLRVLRYTQYYSQPKRLILATNGILVHTNNLAKEKRPSVQASSMRSINILLQPPNPTTLLRSLCPITSSS
jgi:hypothetical protein